MQRAQAATRSVSSFCARSALRASVSAIWCGRPHRKTRAFILSLVLVLGGLAGIVLVRSLAVAGAQHRLATAADAAATEAAASLGTPPHSVPQAAAAPLALESMEAVRRQVPFTIRLPEWLPDGLTLRGAYVGPTQSVAVSYGQSGDPAAGLGLEEGAESASPAGYAFPPSVRQHTLVNGMPATYVHGAWNERGQWQDGADVVFVSWQQGGLIYAVHASGLQLSRDELLRIAESITP